MVNNGMHVIFGAGPLGKAVMEDLIGRGRSVRVVNRSGKADLLPGVELVRCDAREPEQVMRVCKDAAVVYNCTGLPYAEWREIPKIMNGLIEGVSGTNAILLYSDNLYAYGPVEGQISESQPYRPVGWKTVIRGEASTMLMNAHKQGKVRAVIGRAPGFYGPGVMQSVLGSGVFSHLIEDKPVDALGNIDAPHSLIYIKDFARGLVTLGETEAALGEIWHIPCDEATTVRQLTERIASLLGKKPKYRVANKVILTLISIFSPSMREFQELFYQYQKPFVVDDSKFRSAFDFQVTPHDEAIRTTLDWFLSRK